MRLHAKPGYHEIHQQRAQKAADFVGVKLHTLDLEATFKEKVIHPFVKTYKEGKTPNPCAVCNRNLKFGEMIQFADKIGADFLATGHYVKCDGKFFYQAEDDTKDQSYFLFDVEKEILPRILFPLGERQKSDIKAMASSIQGLESFASQSESHDICFVENSYTDVLKEYNINVDQEGEVLDLDGNVVGTHKGYMHYTIGKRRGFSVNGAHVPHYVIDLIPHKNQIVVGTKEKLECKRVVLDNINMFTDSKEFECEVKLRYRTKAVGCKVTIKDNKATVALKEGVFGVATGQAGVFYEKNKLLGGGWIVQNH
jgi:tRNA-specific 2-thiouridylase